MQGKRPPGRAKRGAGWEQAGTTENTVLNGECTLPVRLTVKVGDCDGKKATTVEGTARIDRAGVRFDPETQDRFRKLRVLPE